MPSRGPRICKPGALLCPRLFAKVQPHTCTAHLGLRCRSLITKVRRAKTAAEERAIIKKELAYLRSALSQDSAASKYTKRNIIKLMYLRMLGYPVEFGQVPCLALITAGDYSGKVRA